MARTVVTSEVTVLTTFSGVDHSTQGEPPRLFETRVFGGVLDSEERGTRTRADALEAHAALAEWCRIGASPDCGVTEAGHAPIEPSIGRARTLVAVRCRSVSLDRPTRYSPIRITPSLLRGACRPLIPVTGIVTALPDLTPLQWLLAGLGAIGVGLSKAGLAGVGLLHVVIFAFLFGARDSTGVVLPMLLAGDVTAVTAFHQHARWDYIRRMLPPACLGVIAGRRA